MSVGAAKHTFKLERYFSDKEFADGGDGKPPFMLSASDVEPLTMTEVLEMANEEDLALWNNLSLGYTESRGHPALLEAAAALYGEDIGPPQLLEVVPEEGILIAMSTLLEKSSTVICMVPAYQSLFEVGLMQEANVLFWDANRTSKRFEVSDLRSMIGLVDLSMVVINSPHNPTGHQWTLEELEEIIAICKENGNAVLFSDEMYAHMAETQVPSAVELYDNAVALSGVSKSFSAPGLRCGWLATRNAAFMELFEAQKDFTTICGSAPTEVLATIILHNADVLLERTRTIVKENGDAAAQFFAKWSHWLEYTAPMAGPVAVVKLDDSCPLPKAEEFAAKLLAAKNVLLLPVSVYDIDGSHSNGQGFRIGLSRKGVAEALQLLGEFLEEL